MNKDTLIQYLKKANHFQEVDETQVNLYLQTIWVAEEAFNDIKQRGVQVNIAKSGSKPYYQTNGSIGAFFSSIKSIQTIANSLGLSPKARKELGFEADLPTEDALDKYAEM